MVGACARNEPETKPTATAEARLEVGQENSHASTGTSATRQQTSQTQSDEPDADSEGAVSIHRWAIRMRPSETIRIDNPHGDIRIKNSADAGLDFAGTIQKLGDETRDPQFGSQKFAGGLALSISAPERWTGRVDAGIRAPKGAPLNPTTSTGLIDIKVSNNPITAITQSGQLALRTGARIVAKSTSGNIRASFESPEFEGDAGSLESQSGDIEVWIRPDASVQIIATGARLENGLAGLTTERQGTDGETRVITIGDGDAQLRVSTLTGLITVKALPVPIRR